jgi:hypothetical protein
MENLDSHETRRHGNWRLASTPDTLGSQINVQMHDNIIVLLHFIGRVQSPRSEARLSNANVGLEEADVAGVIDS